eukprot:16446909-Heterocapsa_arctica.AAC.1
MRELLRHARKGLSKASEMPSCAASSSPTPTQLPPSARLAAESTYSNHAQHGQAARPMCMPAASAARSGAREVPVTSAQSPDMLSK